MKIGPMAFMGLPAEITLIIAFVLFAIPDACPQTGKSDSFRVESPKSTSEMGGWRLVRTPNPRGGADAVSIMRTADSSRSDIDLAGMAVRCGEIGAEVLVV